MSRSGYTDDCDHDWQLIMWRGAVKSAIQGRRGQAFLREMLIALDALPEKRLIVDELEAAGEVCALGAIGRLRGVDMTNIDPYDRETVAATFGVAPALAAEIMYVNDEDIAYWRNETPGRTLATCPQLGCAQDLSNLTQTPVNEMPEPHLEPKSNEGMREVATARLSPPAISTGVMAMPDDFNPNLPEPPEEADEPDCDAELDFESLVATKPRPMNDRDKPITVPPDLVHELWCAIKDARDVAAQVSASEGRLNALLKRMRAAGMADWLPTLDEVIAAGPYERIEC